MVRLSQTRSRYMKGMRVEGGFGWVKLCDLTRGLPQRIEGQYRCHWFSPYFRSKPSISSAIACALSAGVPHLQSKDGGHLQSKDGRVSMLVLSRAGQPIVVHFSLCALRIACFHRFSRVFAVFGFVTAALNVFPGFPCILNYSFCKDGGGAFAMSDGCCCCRRSCTVYGTSCLQTCCPRCTSKGRGRQADG